MWVQRVSRHLDISSDCYDLWNSVDVALVTVTEMLLAILSICSQEELVDSDSESGEGKTDEVATAELAARRQEIKNKILAVGRMQRVFQLLRCVVSLALYLV